MAVKKPAGESAYQRRIRRYLELHPGATRQQARGHGGGSEYQKRTAGLTGEARARAGGKRGPAAFLAYLDPGALVMMEYGRPVLVDRRGRLSFEKRVIPAGFKEERVFRFRRFTKRELRALIRDELQRGAVLSPAPSLDQRQLLHTEGLR